MMYHDGDDVEGVGPVFVVFDRVHDIMVQLRPLLLDLLLGVTSPDHASRVQSESNCSHLINRAICLAARRGFPTSDPRTWHRGGGGT